MDNSLQTILGSRGTIGTFLAKELLNYTTRVRVVSRKPHQVNPEDEVVTADLLDAHAVDSAVAGSSVVYLTVGLEYKAKVWQEQWPRLMENVLQATRKHGAKLVFFDNVYALGKVIGPMTEDTPIKPTSRKGAVRAQLEQLLLAEMKRPGTAGVIITRAPDFYGPQTPLSFFNLMVLANLLKDKAAQHFLSADRVHSHIYTPDAARAMALLGNTPEAFNQVWHLPTDPTPVTTRQLGDMAAQQLGKVAKHTVMPSWMVSLIGLFVGFLGEYKEMLYQNEVDYLFDSSKFERRFGKLYTPYAQGLQASLHSLQSQPSALL